MGRKPLTPPINNTTLGDQIQISRDGAPGLQGQLDAALEVAGHAGSVLGQNPKHVVADEVDVFFRIEAEHVKDAGGEEADCHVVVGEDEVLEQV